MKNFKPKSQDKKGSIIVFHGLCKGCGLCLLKCPQKAIRFSKKDLGVYSTPTIEIDPAKCNHCKICEITCPDAAISIKK